MNLWVKYTQKRIDCLFNPQDNFKKQTAKISDNKDARLAKFVSPKTIS